MAHCLLDILPVELLHALFSYFLAHEILLTFASVSPYIDAILVSYTNYRVDFKSILKTHFDLVCRTITADQIISLTLSGLDDTPKQCQLFFTHFRIEHFSRLRSLRLINIDKQLMKNIVNFIDKLNRYCQIENTSYSAMLNIAESVPPPEPVPSNSGNSVIIQYNTSTRH
jgi:hypothetical protein